MSKERIHEIINNLKAFDKESYRRDELLPELLKLQTEMVEMTFNEEHASLSNLKIWDVKNHLVQLNNECGNIADEEMQKFSDEVYDYSNMIRGIISGNKGEAKVFNILDSYKYKGTVLLKNIELSNDGDRTEIDALVVTPKALVIVEVKNTGRDIFIDENGDYYRMGRFLRWDSNIKEKFETKEALLKKALGKEYEDCIVNKVVVFTNDKVEIQNKYQDMETCFLTQLTYVIERFDSGRKYEKSDMDDICTKIKIAEELESYPVRFDIDQFKYDFAVIMAMLEDAHGEKEIEETVDDADCISDEEISEKRNKKQAAYSLIKKVLTSQVAAMFGGVVVGGIAAFIAESSRR